MEEIGRKLYYTTMTTKETNTRRSKIVHQCTLDKIHRIVCLRAPFYATLVER